MLPQSQTLKTQELVRITGLSRTYGSFVAVHPLDLSIGQGEFVAILGPSGCGKTTLLKMIGGFAAPSTGAIFIDGEDVTRTPPERRSTNTVFQGYGLFPHMTVAQNIAYGLRLRKLPGPQIAARVAEAIALVHLEGLADRDVSLLSGGQAQRVALARALILRPRVLLLDEPLAALDLKLRKSMQAELKRIHEATGGTFVFVTHDQEEAMALANRICVMEGGRIVQDGSPEEIYHRPKTRFVSTFIGEANILNGERKRGFVRIAGGNRFASKGLDGPVTGMVRPEQMEIALRDEEDLPHDIQTLLDAKVTGVKFLGPFVRYTVVTRRGQELAIDSRYREQQRQFAQGDEVAVGWRKGDLMFISGE